MTSLAASVELELVSDVSEVAEVAEVAEAAEATGSAGGYQRCSSRPFKGCRSLWSEGRLRLKKPHWNGIIGNVIKIIHRHFIENQYNSDSMELKYPFTGIC